MYHVLLAVHIITCLFLIVSILLQAGRGGGLTETFSGQTQSVLGSQAPDVLKKATEISAILFLVLSLLLAMMTTRRGKSLFQQMQMPAAVPAAASAAGAATGTDAAVVDAAEAGEPVAASVAPETQTESDTAAVN